MNKIPSIDVKDFKEWCCGKDLELNYLCGDFYNKNTKVICDSCLLNISIRKAKINSIREEIKQIHLSELNSTRALNFGFTDMKNILTDKIKRIQDGRD